MFGYSVIFYQLILTQLSLTWEKVSEQNVGGRSDHLVFILTRIHS
jgi:hypothetical protein